MGLIRLLAPNTLGFCRSCKGWHLWYEYSKHNEQSKTKERKDILTLKSSSRQNSLLDKLLNLYEGKHLIKNGLAKVKMRCILKCP